jgi:hypothetical protein
MIYDAFSQQFCHSSTFQYTKLEKDWIKSSLFFIDVSYFHGGDGPSGVGIEVEFPFVILVVVFPAIVLPLTV